MDEDDEFLYGDNSNTQEAPPASLTLEEPPAEVVSTTHDEINKVEAIDYKRDYPATPENDEDAEDSSDSESDVEIIMDSPNASKTVDFRPQRNSLGRSASQVATPKPNITTEYIPQERPSISTPKETPQPITQVDNTTAITSTANVAGTATTQSIDAPERALAPTEAQKGDANDFFLKRAQAMAEDPPKVLPSPSTAPSLDIDPATLDAAAVYDIDINAIDSEKPWRQPGADLTDWFNYGFDEYKWLDYASRKKNLGSTVEKINPFAAHNSTPDELLNVLPPELQAMMNMMPPMPQVGAMQMPGMPMPGMPPGMPPGPMPGMPGMPGMPPGFDMSMMMGGVPPMGMMNQSSDSNEVKEEDYADPKPDNGKYKSKTKHYNDKDKIGAQDSALDYGDDPSPEDDDDSRLTSMKDDDRDYKDKSYKDKKDFEKDYDRRGSPVSNTSSRYGSRNDRDSSYRERDRDSDKEREKDKDKAREREREREKDRKPDRDSRRSHNRSRSPPSRHSKDRDRDRYDYKDRRDRDYRDRERERDRDRYDSRRSGRTSSRS